MKTKFRWYKFRLGWSHGYSKWDYTNIPYGYTARRYFESRDSEYSYSEHFRGHQWKKIKSPPKEFLEKEIENEKMAIKSCTEQLQALKKELKSND